jgi:hypothetical protein|tara:strand:+ start:11786 stop:12124 length:339 start_codon:yes stop_codon:yes gene_type:complete
MKKKILCFDIDGVICTKTKGLYSNAKPLRKNIKKINDLYERGFYIKIYTARYMGRTNDNKNLAKKKAEKITLAQLKRWKIKFHKLFFGKISYDLLIDDKSFGYNSNWIKIIK